MAKKTAPPALHTIAFQDVQAVYDQTRKLREDVLAVKNDGHSPTTQVILDHVAARLKGIMRQTLVARSGPDFLEELRKEGRDV